MHFSYSLTCDVAISIWQYRNPTKAIRFWFQPEYTKVPTEDDAFHYNKRYFLPVGFYSKAMLKARVDFHEVV